MSETRDDPSGRQPDVPETDRQSASDIEQLSEALSALEPYVDHKQSCLSRSGNGQDTDFCNCGVDEVVQSVDSALREVAADADPNS